MQQVKDIFFIRHGETEANKLRIHQSSDECLTPKGKLQAHHISHFLEGQKIDTLLCSTYVRARQTAEIISRALQVPYTEDENFVEVRRPDHIYGQRYYSKETLWYMWRLFRFQETSNWHQDGAENMFALRNRIENVKRTIATSEGDKIAVVTHDVFMNLFFEHVCTDRKLTFVQFVRILLTAKKTPNAAIVHMQYNNNAPKGMCAWQYVRIVDTSVKSSRTKAQRA
jgi:2,3-bisphosphoglycerate-dependent phosphoglycerate mutase